MVELDVRSRAESIEFEMAYGKPPSRLMKVGKLLRFRPEDVEDLLRPGTETNPRPEPAANRSDSEGATAI
jgi:hypothetical protein